MKRKAPRERLIDDSALMIQRVKPHEAKPDFMFRSSVHLDWIRGLACEFCGASGQSQACHLWIGTNTAGGSAKSEKPHDYWAWPGCSRCHRRQHFIGERTVWTQHGIHDPNDFVLRKYAMQSPCPRTRAAAVEELRRRCSGAQSDGASTREQEGDHHEN